MAIKLDIATSIPGEIVKIKTPLYLKRDGIHDAGVQKIYEKITDDHVLRLSVFRFRDGGVSFSIQKLLNMDFSQMSHYLTDKSFRSKKSEFIEEVKKMNDFVLSIGLGKGVTIL